MECVPLLSAQLFALFDFFFIKTYVISSIFIECEEKIVMRVCVCVYFGRVQFLFAGRMHTGEKGDFLMSSVSAEKAKAVLGL